MFNNIILLGTRDLSRVNWSKEGEAIYQFYPRNQYILEYYHTKKIKYGIGFYVKNYKQLNFVFIEVVSIKLVGNTWIFKYKPVQDSGISSDTLFKFNNGRRSVSDGSILEIAEYSKISSFFQNNKIYLPNEWDNHFTFGGVEKTVQHEVNNTLQQINNESDKVKAKKKICIFHGHNHFVRDMVKILINDVGHEAIILSDRINTKTIYEEVEQINVDAVICIFTPDDIGGEFTFPNYSKELKMRARQNVIFEFGFSIARFGDERVLLLVIDSVEKFSNIDGVKYISIESNYTSEKWKEDITEWIRNLEELTTV